MVKVSKPALFKKIGYVPHPGQIKVHKSKVPMRVVVCGTRWGKTTCAAAEGLWAALSGGKHSVGWCVAPNYELATKVYREIERYVFEYFRNRVVRHVKGVHLLVIRNLSGGETEIRAKSADNAVSLLGEGLDWVIVDEASRLRPEIWDGYVSQRLIDKKGWALLISTPAGKNYFHDLYQRGVGGDERTWSHHAPSWENPHLDREVIEAQRGKIPDRAFAQEYEASFIEGAGQVFRRVREAAVGEWEECQPGRRYVAGLDLARVSDYTVFVVMDEHRRVVFRDRWHGMEWDVQIGRLGGASQRYGHPPTLVDSTGLGGPVLEQLQKAGLNVSGYALNQQSKASLIDNLTMMLERDQLVLPRAALWPELLDELESFQYSTGPTGTVKSGAPKGSNDDCVIALALAAYQLRDGMWSDFVPGYRAAPKVDRGPEPADRYKVWTPSGETIDGGAGWPTMY